MNPVGELWPWILVSLALGFALAWLIKRRAPAGIGIDRSAEVARLQADLDAARRDRAALERDLAAARAEAAQARTEAEAVRADARRLTAAPVASAVHAEAQPLRSPPAAGGGNGGVGGGSSDVPASAVPAAPRSITISDPAAAPATEPSAGGLTRLKGVGPKLATLLEAEGIRTLPDMAALSDDQAAALDARLGSFAGRVTRDRLPEQARLLTEGRHAEYAARFGAPGA